MDISKSTFLVVDRTNHACQLVQDMLRELQAGKIYYATSIEEAKTHLMTGTINCLICEHNLQDENGFKLIKGIRHHPKERIKKLPIILLTSSTEKSHITTARDLGVDEIIAKPFPAKVLKMRLDAIANNRRTFVVDRVYTGPDRRRRNKDFDGEDKRTS